MSTVFSEEILIDKLAKLSSTQQAIETLSHYCIYNRVKAELIVTTWEKQFHSTEMTQKVPLMYLANDILQNSKRQGNEFVQAFWNVLPKAVKDIVAQGDDRGKGVVSRLVKIWEERRVFGSRSKNLKDVMLGEEVPLPLDISKKRPRGSRSSKRDSKSSRTKSSSGAVAEKIASAYHLVVAENSNEEAEMNKCKSAVKRIRKMEKDVEEACSTAKDNPKRKSLAKELEEEEYLLRQCIEKLKSVQGSRTSLVNQLKDALREQESELENLKAQIQVAKEQTEEAQNMQKRLSDDENATKPTTVAPGFTETSDDNTKSGQSSKMTPASIAAMLTASTSSHMIMQSVLSSFAAEATKTSGLSISESSTVPVSDTNAFTPTYNNSQNQIPTTQSQYHVIPNLAQPPPPPQFLKPPVMNSPYGFGNIPLMPPGLPPPPPPPPQHMIGNQQPQIPQSNSAQQQSQPGPTFQPPGIMYYGAPHHS
uniref:Regulation of nuclear pre-mRNA domain-containing protein 1A n=1 Tax=Noccaea caerulescens TaxID=107243 RepID=A0A1J3GYC7_NOCCA